MRTDPRHWADPSEPQSPASSFEPWRTTRSKRNLLVLIVILGVAGLSPVLFDVVLGDRLHGPEPEVVAACDHWAGISEDLATGALTTDNPATRARVARMLELAVAADDDQLERRASVAHVRLQEDLDRAFADSVEGLDGHCDFLMSRWSGLRGERVPVDTD
jgi:hypothetical protein